MAQKEFVIGGNPKEDGCDFLGLNTRNKNPKALKRGEAQDSLNWLTGTYKDHIELRMGTSLLGKTRRLGSGKVTGLGIGTTNLGVQIPYFSYAQKIINYSATTDDTTEISTNLLPAAASGEDIAFAPYINLAGAWMYFSSKHSSIYKINLGNPTTFLDMNCPDTRGFIAINLSRLFLWNIFNSLQNVTDTTDLYQSVVDKKSYTGYTQTTQEVVGSGDGATKTFTHTLAGAATTAVPFAVSVFGQLAAVVITAITNAVQAKVTTSAPHGLTAGAFVEIVDVVGMTQINKLFLRVVTIADANNFTVNIDSTGFTAYSSAGTVGAVELFSDDGNGSLTGSLGGTGTVNYITGAVSVTFNTAPVSGTNNVCCAYYTETKTGSIVDFSFSPTRTSGQGNIYQEFGGGVLQNTIPFNGSLYNLHTNKSWQLTIPADDTQALDTIYRESVGIPYWRAAFGDDDGIFYLDSKNKTDPMIRFLTLTANQASVNVVPDPISDNLDLTKNGFDAPVAFAFGNLYLLSCQGVTNGVNDPSNDFTYVFNKISRQWDKLDYGFTCAANMSGQMLYGDTISNNVWKAFSGYDDDGSIINNYWISGAFDLGIDGLKRANRFLIDGFINTSQNFDILMAFDNGAFVNIGNIDGRGTYVDNGVGVLIGSDMIGSQVVGSGAVVNAYHYRFEFIINNSPARYEYVTIKLVANAVGALQVNEMRFKDIRYKGQKTIPSYETTA